MIVERVERSLSLGGHRQEVCVCVLLQQRIGSVFFHAELLKKCQKEVLSPGGREVGREGGPPPSSLSFPEGQCHAHQESFSSREAGMVQRQRQKQIQAWGVTKSTVCSREGWVGVGA